MNKGKVETVCRNCGCIDWLHTLETTTCKKCKKDYKKGSIEFTFVTEEEIKKDLKGYRIYNPNALG